VVHAVQTLSAWLAQRGPSEDKLRCVFSVHNADVTVSAFATASQAPIECLCGPEGGLSAQEEAAAIAHGYSPVGLGPRVLRSETAPLAALAVWTL
jgi:16S rRNA (uracil1498-N3)-methyltransferase